MERIQEILTTIDNWLWGNWLLFVLLAVGILYTVISGGVQVRHFKYIIKKTLIHPIRYGDKDTNSEGSVSSFQALNMAIASCVGSGNIVGVATAVLAGGLGAIFWMWISAFLGMATIYGEAVLAQTYKTEVNGEVTGGPVYYIKAAFKGNFGKVLSTLFAIFIVLALGFMGNMVQSNSISTAFSQVFTSRNISIPPFTVGLLLAVVSLFVFIGGTNRLAAVVEKLVPFMALVYIAGSLIVILCNITRLPSAVAQIFLGAFNPSAVLGGAAGVTVKEAIRYGVARGLFSNEAGMGSTPHAHARAVVKNPHCQGLAAMISVFIDTFIVLNLTVFSILTTNSLSSGKDGIMLTQYAFSTVFGSFGDIFIAVCLLFFAFSTILGWEYNGEKAWEYLFGTHKYNIIYRVAFSLVVFVGATQTLDLVWNLSDIANALMAIPNLISLLVLSPVIKEEVVRFQGVLAKERAEKAALAAKEEGAKAHI